MASSDSACTGHPASDDEKSHTFRKRRLSLSRHNFAFESNQATTSTDSPPLPLMLAPSLPSGGAVTSESKFSCNVADPQNDEESTAAESAASDQKAHTFRKRRLSLNSMSHSWPGAGDKNDGAAREECSPANKVPKKTDGLSPPISQDRRPRRSSDASLSSLRSSQSVGEGVLRVRTIHAGEILGQSKQSPPSSSIGFTGDFDSLEDAGTIGLDGSMDGEHQRPHVLYRQSRPSSKSLLHDIAGITPPTCNPQPKWRKRIIRHDGEDERKLPFPRDVVGTYSCHGVEPIFENDFDIYACHDDDEDNWTEEISGASNSLTPPGNDANVLAVITQATRSEPKPTTAAKINQDRGGVAFPYGNCPKTALFAAYDGHGQGGELVSQYALHEIQSRLEKRPEFHSDLEKAFIETFLAVDGDLKNEAIIEPLYAGTTACVALLRDKVITCANAGDSRAVIARRKKNLNCRDNIGLYEAIDLTVDQNPDLPAERQRIESMGGFVSPPPEPGLSARVWLDEGFSQIGLAMARSIGDHAVAQVGVIPTPVVSTHTVGGDDEFLIIATDGVWEFISSEAAVEIVGSNLSRGATKATQSLIEAAAARWHDEEGDYRDDITALVIHLPELWRGEPK